MQNDDTVYIRLIGIGCHIVKCTLEEDIWNKIKACAKELKLPIGQAFFDSEFYSLLNTPAYSSWQDFNNFQDISGLLESHRSQVEIRLNKKPRKKIVFNDLNNTGLLFPLYNVESVSINMDTKNRSVTIIEQDVGTTAFYKFHCKEFEIDKMSFRISKVKTENNATYSILSGIFYNGLILTPYKSDALVTSIHAVVN